ncbi:reverse transcriptase [Gossypium australe]|uniref:Reverse transcriptase n=1 Tax=Gossypium australe TaxID=47621 RepID=A0A5B6WR48_9ROSI|nr:reverse transcriptase [Gossypium australe]
MLKEKRDRFDLGFKPDAKQMKKVIGKKQERRKARLNGEDVKWELMTFPHISHTFVLGGIIYPEKGLFRDENPHINAIHDEKTEQGNLLGIRPYEPGCVLDNWTAEEFPVVFRDYTESLNINDMSNDTTDPEVRFDQDMCSKESQDFEGDRDCDLPPDLLRMVKQEEKQILPHEEEVENISLEEGKMVKIGTRIAVETRQDLVELLQEFKDVFARSYQDMPGLSTNIVVHRLPIREECKPVQQRLRRMRLDVILKIKDEKDGKVRMCVDYRDLNRASPKDNFHLPHIDTLVDNTAGYSLFSFMDGFSGYNQIKMHLEDMEKTTFITLWGTFCYKVMPFGLKNAGATYQRAIVTLFHDMMHKKIEVYVDDMIAKSRTEKEHIEVLKKLFLRLKKFQMKISPAKCTFGARSGKLLGFVVSERGIEVDSNKVKAIKELPLPHTQKEVRGFLGRLNYIARFISQLTEKCDPIFRLLKKHNQCVWDEECQSAFNNVKQYLTNAPVLSPPNLDRPLILYLSVFNNSMGCVLGQHDESGRKEKAIKGSAIAEFLASRALEDYEPLSFELPNEELMYVATTEECLWKLNFDGASNAVGNGIGAVLVSPNGDHYPFTCKLDFDCTNNMAEYEACIMGIQATIEHKIRVLEVYGDSALVIYQLKGEWETRDPKLINYRRIMADALTTLASMIKVSRPEDMRPIQMSILEVATHCYNVEEEEMDVHPWYHDVLRYVKNCEYLEHATENEKKTLRRLASDYVLDGDILYKKRKDHVLLRCVDAIEARKILEEVHEGVCGTHTYGFTMARQIMRFGYHWSTMEGDCINYAKRCHKCQIYGDKIHVPPSPLHVMTSPWPFSMWGMDVIGPISPKASNGHQFIFVVIDYFTKWVDAASYASVTKSAVSRFL